LNKRNTILNQLMQLLLDSGFRSIVNSVRGDKYSKTLDCDQQLAILLYAQIKELKSLRDIQTSLKSHADKFPVLGLKSAARSTLADANRDRPYQMFEDLFYKFLEKCHKLAPGHKFRFKMPVFIQDSTLINVSLSAFPWARYRRRKGALKLHLLLDSEGCLPSFIRMTSGKVHDINAVRNFQYDFPALPPDSILTLDRGYLDFQWLHSLHSTGTTFVIRAKSNMAYTVVGQHAPAKQNLGIIADELIVMENFYEQKKYPESLRRITFYDKEKKRIFIYLTNNKTLAATSIARIYKGRWDIEKFFKWIKQNLKIKSFLGTTENAVMTQVWVAMILYLLLSFIKFQTRYTFTLLEFLRVLREVILESKNIIEVLRFNFQNLCSARAAPIQLSFL
jgi:hypothetical protein